jgi:putative ABC transport system substrate-binding protein
MKKIISTVVILALVLSLSAFAFAEGETYKVGICNFVDDASLNQIIANICSQLAVIGEEKGVTFEISEDNCNTDANVMNQIIANFIADKVDLMVGVATPVAMGMQAATEDNGIPVVFAAVSDPVGAGLVDTLEAPGANLTGTSDYLDTNAVMNLIFAADPEADLIGLLYNVGEDSSTAPIAAAKAYLDEKGVKYVERTGTTVDEVMLAAEALVSDGVDAVFTPTDNTIMTAELAIYETFVEAGIPHYTGADSFALNGAFLGYGVDYANLGVETGNMVADILLNGKDPGEVPVMTFDNGTATVNTDICDLLGLDYDTIAETFAPYCTKVQPITTAESFEDLA